MADAEGVKPDAHRIVNSLPESATWDDLAFAIYVRQAVATGLTDDEAGRTLSHDEAMARIGARLRRASRWEAAPLR